MGGAPTPDGRTGRGGRGVQRKGKSRRRKELVRSNWYYVGKLLHKFV